MGMPQVKVREIMERTIANLDFVQKHQGESGPPYEVTQLINSFLGAFIQVKEHWFDRIPETKFEKLSTPQWPRIPTDAGYDDPENLRELVRLMRNGMAHGNFDLLPDNQGNIAKLRIWNNNLQCVKTWGTELSVKDLDLFLRRFVQEMACIDEL